MGMILTLSSNCDQYRKNLRICVRNILGVLQPDRATIRDLKLLSPLERRIADAIMIP